jgi:diaminopimelate epimerase
MQFVKMQATGNDFILFNIPSDERFFTRGRIKNICDRHLGVGADGLILIFPARDKKSDFRMRFFNADGSEAEMCGNGIRCLGKLVYESGLIKNKELIIKTRAGSIPIKLITENNIVKKVFVHLPLKPKVTTIPKGLIPACIRQTCIRGDEIVRVLLGNPHCVVFVNNVTNFPVEKYGPLIERHRLFPKRTNVEFVKIINRNQIRMRVWERGVGETLSCGTGACASVIAGISANKLRSNNVKVHLPGGVLEVSWQKDSGLFLTGTAEMVFNGNI